MAQLDIDYTGIRTGAFIVTLLAIVCDGVGIVSTSMVLVYYLPDLKSFLDQVSMEVDERSTYKVLLDLSKTFIPLAIQVLLATFVISFLVSGILLYGVYKKKSSFMLPWLIAKFLGLLGAILIFGYGVIVLGMAPVSGYWVLAFLAFGLAILTLGYIMYYVIRAEYMHINEEACIKRKELRQKFASFGASQLSSEGQNTIIHNENVKNSMSYNPNAYFVKMVDIIEEIHKKAEQNPEVRFIRMLDPIEEVPDPETEPETEPVNDAELGQYVRM